MITRTKTRVKKIIYLYHKVTSKVYKKFLGIFFNRIDKTSPLQLISLFNLFLTWHIHILLDIVLWRKELFSSQKILKLDENSPKFYLL